jgi:hypothetical protein
MLNIGHQVVVWLAIYLHLTYRVMAKRVPGGVGEAICTEKGTGNTAFQATKDCCAAVDHEAYFSEFIRECWAEGGPWHKAIKYREFAECCANRSDAGSSSSNRSSFLRLGVQPDPLEKVAGTKSGVGGKIDRRPRVQISNSATKTKRRKHIQIN